MRLTNGGEFAAFLLARVITVAIIYATNMMFIAPLYVRLYRSGGGAAIPAVGLGISAVGWLITLVLLLLFRAAFGSVPPAVAAPADKSAVTTSGGEIGAFAVSALIVTVVQTVVTTYLIVGLYRWLQVNGHAGQIILVSLGVSAVTAIVFFLIFIVLRDAMGRSAPAEGAGI